jgi:hypothetical protein
MSPYPQRAIVQSEEEIRLLKALLYTGETDGKVKLLEALLVRLLGEKNIEVFHHMDALTQYFYKPRPVDGFTIGVFLVADAEDLRQLAAIRDITDNVRIILILPDRENITIAEGHKLQPRFVTYKDSNFREIGAVVGKMIQSATCAPSSRN